MTNRPRSAPSAAQKAEEARQAIVLLVIVVLFLITNTLRIILNINGLFQLKAGGNFPGIFILLFVAVPNVLAAPARRVSEAWGRKVARESFFSIHLPFPFIPSPNNNAAPGRERRLLRKEEMIHDCC